MSSRWLLAVSWLVAGSGAGALVGAAVPVIWAAATVFGVWIATPQYALTSAMWAALIALASAPVCASIGIMTAAVSVLGDGLGARSGPSARLPHGLRWLCSLLGASVVVPIAWFLLAQFQTGFLGQQTVLSLQAAIVTVAGSFLVIRALTALRDHLCGSPASPAPRSPDDGAHALLESVGDPR